MTNIKKWSSIIQTQKFHIKTHETLLISLTFCESKSFEMDTDTGILDRTCILEKDNCMSSLYCSYCIDCSIAYIFPERYAEL